MTDRPEFITDDYLEYLDELQESSVTNMYGAGRYLVEEFPDLNRFQAKEVVLFWMDSFEERHPK